MKLLKRPLNISVLMNLLTLFDTHPALAATNIFKKERFVVSKPVGANVESKMIAAEIDMGSGNCIEREEIEKNGLKFGIEDKLKMIRWKLTRNLKR